MSPFVTWSKKILSGSRSLTGSPRRARSAPRMRFRPRLDAMENRTLLSTLTVTNDQDSGPGSLRSAIGKVAAGDTIGFAHSLRGEWEDLHVSTLFRHAPSARLAER
jgi:hypothetical protein